MEMDDVLMAIHERRIFVLLECDIENCEEDSENPHFHRVCLTDRQYKKVSDAIITKIKKDDSLKPGFEMTEMRLDGYFDPKQFDGLSPRI